MKIALERIKGEDLARYLENSEIRVTGVTPLMEPTKPGETHPPIHYTVEMEILGKLKETMLGLLAAGAGKPEAEKKQEKG